MRIGPSVAPLASPSRIARLGRAAQMGDVDRSEVADKRSRRAGYRALTLRDPTAVSASMFAKEASASGTNSQRNRRRVPRERGAERKEAEDGHQVPWSQAAAAPPHVSKPPLASRQCRERRRASAPDDTIAPPHGSEPRSSA